MKIDLFVAQAGGGIQLSCMEFEKFSKNETQRTIFVLPAKVRFGSVNSKVPVREVHQLINLHTGKQFRSSNLLP